MHDATLSWFDGLPVFVRFASVVIAILVCGHYLGRPAIRKTLQWYGIAEPVQDAAEDTFSTVLVFLAVIAALAVTEIDAVPSTSSAVLAAATLSAGIGAREIIRNLVSGFFLFNNEDIDVDSWIEWDGRTGVVEAISLRVTKIRTFDDETVVVPNSKLTDDVVVTPASNGKLRIRYLFGVDYDATIDDVRDYILEEARSIEGVADDPEPSVLVVDLGSSSVHLDARVWLAGQPTHRDAVRVRSELITRVKSRLQTEGISLSAPDQDLTGNIDISAADED